MHGAGCPGTVLVKGFYVVVDKETGVNYLVAKFGAGAGICPLIDKDGKPIVTK